MPRNGSGQYSAPVNGWNPAINNTPATAADWQALLNDLVAALTQSVSRDGQTPITQNMPMGNNKFTGLSAGTAAGDSLRFEQLFSQGLPQELASAATTDIGAQLTTILKITGTDTITSFGSNFNGPRFLRFTGVLTLTHSASLLLPGAQNITTAVGDCAIVVPNGYPASGWAVVAYQLSAVAPGVPVIPDNSITVQKLQTVATSTLLGRSTTGTGSVEVLTLGPGVTIGGGKLSGDFASSTENAAGAIEGKSVDPLGVREAFNATGSAPVFACRAWVNFNGVGTVAIRASGNVTGITDNGVGDYTVNFTTAMSDANYSAVITPGFGSGSRNALRAANISDMFVGSVRYNVSFANGQVDDTIFQCVTITR